MPALDLDFFKCKVEPIPDPALAACLAMAARRRGPCASTPRGRLRNMETVTETGCPQVGTQVSLVPTCVGRHRVYLLNRPHTATSGSATSTALAPLGWMPITSRFPVGMEDTSELIAQPIVGGKAHASVHLFRSGDADHTTLKQWLGGSKLGMTCNTINQAKRGQPMKRLIQTCLVTCVVLTAHAVIAFPS